MQIRLDALDTPEVHALLQQHLEDMALHSPPESVHALDLGALTQPDVSFFTLWDDGQLLGCGALRHLDATSAEIKSMRTDPRHRRRGVARRILMHLLQESRDKGYRHLFLETGSMAAFEPARRLYESAGFRHCEPFADYEPDRHSVFMTLTLPIINQAK